MISNTQTLWKGPYAQDECDPCLGRTLRTRLERWDHTYYEEEGEENIDDFDDTLTRIFLSIGEPAHGRGQR